MPKVKNKSSGAEEDSDWETVSHRRQHGPQDGHQDHCQDRRHSKTPPKSGKTKPDGKESTPTRSDSLGGKRAWNSDSEPEGKVDPKRTQRSPPSHHSTPTKQTDSLESNTQKLPKISKLATKTNPQKPGTSWADDEPEVNPPVQPSPDAARGKQGATEVGSSKPSYAQATKLNPEFKKPLPIPDWQDLELRIFKTNYSQIPISHKEFNEIRTKMYDHTFQYLKANSGLTRNTEASHNQWCAALQCGIWACDNVEALAWHKEAISTVTNNHFRAWIKHEKSTQLVKVFPHDSFSHYSAKQFLESVQFYHTNLHLDRWKVLHEYHQQRGNRVLVVEVPTQYLELARKKASHSDNGQWRLRGMAMPMRFAMASPNDLHKTSPGQVPAKTTSETHQTTPAQTLLPKADPNISALTSTPTRPATPRTPKASTEKRVGSSTPVVNQPGSSTPLSAAMSGFTLSSPYHQPYTPPIHPLPAQNHGDYYAVYDPQTQTLTPMGNPTYPPQPYYPQPFTQAYPMVPQSYPYQPNPQTFQQPMTQTLGPAVTQTTTPTQATSKGELETSIGPEEMEAVLQGEDGEYSDSDSELLKEDSDEEHSHTNATTTDSDPSMGKKPATTREDDESARKPRK
jgi:hypothetical protein